MKDFTNVQCAHRLLHGTRQVCSLAPTRHAAAYLAQQLQCGCDSLFELVYICRKRGGINQTLHISLKEKNCWGSGQVNVGNHFNITLSSPPSAPDLSPEQIVIEISSHSEV